jgi:DNA (cytosine-5)-methyltransferase 3A
MIKQDRSPNSGLIAFEDFCRYLTTTELELAQTMPIGYTSMLTKNAAERGLGNGWCAEVIIHILRCGLADVPKDEPIEVLSMYDGIGTGRYCLDRLGFSNITYKAYEIDKSAIKCATGNYADIIECGDAFKVRESDWQY